MLVAVVVTLANMEDIGWGPILAGLLVGGGVGAALALRVKMTSMPELVAAFNGFGGVASALVALAEIERTGSPSSTPRPVSSWHSRSPSDRSHSRAASWPSAS